MTTHDHGFIPYAQGWLAGWGSTSDAARSLSSGSSPPERLNASYWIRFEESGLIGQITIWESGEIEVEVLSLPAGEVIVERSERISRVKQLDAILGEFTSIGVGGQ